MWTYLKNRFQQISPMSVTCTFAEVFNTKLLDCKNIVKYISRYQIAFNEMFSLLNDNLWIFKKTIEITL